VNSNEYYIFGKECYLLIKGNKGDILAKVKIDSEDYELVNLYHWTINSKGYVFSIKTTKREKIKKILLHRLLCNLNSYEIEDGLVVDHLNHNRHDNRKQNLKVCTSSENGKNRIIKEKSEFSSNIYRRGRIYE
jgi:hypothetical protein